MKDVQKIAMMIGGTQKAGTTSLLRLLGQHPELRTHRQPEMSFFVNDSEYEMGYESGWKKYFGAMHFDDVKLVSKHVLLMYSRPAIHRLVGHNPDIHLVISLRNPVDRAYSSYWYARRKAWENFDSFEEALECEGERLSHGWYKARRNAYLFAGRYVDFINYLLTILAPQQLHVITSDELAEEPRKVCSALFDAIGVDARFAPIADVSYNRSAAARYSWVATVINQIASSRHPARKMLRRIIPAVWSNSVRQTIDRWNEAEFVPPPMNTDIRQRLIEYYRPYNEQLGMLLRRDFSDWNT